MNHIVTSGIVLTRVDYKEADRIITLLTSDKGKIRVMAKGVRRAQSKLAGGIELFSVSQVTYLPSRGEIHTLVSARLERHYGKIIHDINRTMMGYEMLRRMHRVTEDMVGAEYFDLMSCCLAGLNEQSLHDQLVELWFGARLLDIAGYHPNLQTDVSGENLLVGHNYTFDFEHMAFRLAPEGSFTANHIRLLRVAFASDSPERLARINDAAAYSADVLRLIQVLQQRSGLL